MTYPEDANGTARAHGSRHKGIVKKNSFSSSRGAPLIPVVPQKSDAKGNNWITFVHLGRQYYSIVLWATSPQVHKKWVECVIKQQQVMRERSNIFNTVTLSESFFVGPNKVNCAAPYSK